MAFDARVDAVDATVNDLGQELSKALDFISAEFEEERARAQRYYNGKSDLKSDANRSKYVVTKVRDIVRTVKPSIMRIFMAEDVPAEFLASDLNQYQIADDQSKWVAQLFYDLGGYETLYSAFHSAMLFKIGVIKYYYEELGAPIHREYTGLSEKHVMMLTQHPAVTVLSGEERQVMGPQGLVRVFDVEIEAREMKGDVKMSFVPLTEFLINRNATCKNDARVIAHRRNVPRGDVLEMGIEAELLEDLNSDDAEVTYFAEESEARRGYTVYPSDESSSDWSMQPVLLTEAYYRADIAGTGTAQLYKFLLGGTNYKLLDYERVDIVPFSLFAIDPEPGTVFGKSLYNIVQSEQDAMTSITRATIDNFHMTNNPRLAVHENMVNMEDVLNNDLGSPIRVRSAGQIQVISTPFTGAAAMPLLQQLGRDVEDKTGVTRASSGLDPDAMQSTDKDAVKNTIAMGQGQVELMCRNLAETGLKDLMLGLLHLSMTHLDANQILRTDTGARPVKIDVFDPTMGMRVNVGLGTGNAEDKEMMLNETYAVQKELVMSYGPDNPMANILHMQNTIFDKMRLKGINNPTRYFGVITPEQMKGMGDQFRQQQQIKEQTQQQIAMINATQLQQAEKIKAQAALQIAQGKGAVDIAKAQSQGMIDSAQLQQKERADMRELMVKDDLARDEMSQDLYIETAKLGHDWDKAMLQVQSAQGGSNERK